MMKLTQTDAAFKTRVIMLPDITHWSHVKPPPFGSVLTCEGGTSAALWCHLCEHVFSLPLSIQHLLSSFDVSNCVGFCEAALIIN